MSGDGDEMCSIKVNKFLNKVDILNEKHKLYVKVKKKKKKKIMNQEIIFLLLLF